MAVAGFEMALVKAAIKDAVQRVKETRRNIAFDELCEACRMGKITQEEFWKSDRFAANALTVVRLAAEGVTQKKLKLLARICASMAAGDDASEDEFNVYASILERLSLRDIVFVATLHRHWMRERGGGQQVRLSASRLAEASIPETRAFADTTSELVGKGKPFSTSEEVAWTAAAMISTGLVMKKEITDFSVVGEGYFTTDRVDRLNQLAGLEEWAANQVGS